MTIKLSEEPSPFKPSSGFLICQSIIDLESAWQHAIISSGKLFLEPFNHARMLATWVAFTCARVDFFAATCSVFYLFPMSFIGIKVRYSNVTQNVFRLLCFKNLVYFRPGQASSDKILIYDLVCLNVEEWWRGY